VDVVVDKHALLVRHDDLGRSGGPDVGVEHADGRECQSPPTSCATTNPGTDAGAMPAKVSEKMRPMLIAGLAKLVELVNQ
jgi:hypothetical protein